MNLELTSRDRSLLWATWQNRLMAPRQYLRRFWNGGSHQAVSRRLTKLKDEGLLQYISVPWNLDRRLYTITKAGNRALVDAGLLDPALVLDFPRRPKELSPALLHDLSVVDLRIAFELTGGKTWVSDHQLRLGRPQRLGNVRVADGMFDFDADGLRRRGVLEFERRSYRRPQMAQVLSRLRFDHGEDTIFFVTLNADRARRVWSWTVESGIWGDRPASFLVAPLGSALKSGLKAGFVDLEGRRFEYSRGF
ncbi:MAG TPA: hypothetical protein VK914_07820 [bacterium]|jgi:hypothetical protein|nr:hypothetical protein [bacterium]